MRDEDYIFADPFDLGMPSPDEPSAGSAECSGEYVQDRRLPHKPFPTVYLPEVARDFVSEASASIGCDESMLAPHVLLTLGAAIGNTYRISPKRDWEESSSLWIATIAHSGDGKSPAFEAATRPIGEEEYRLKLEYDTKMALTEDGGTGPKRKRVRVSDVTTESLAVAQADNPRGIALLRDELAGFLGGRDQYKRGNSDSPKLMEMYDGRYTQVDRKSSDPPVIDIRYPHLCVGGTIQPGVLQAAFTCSDFASGFAQRMQYTMPPVRPRLWSENEIGDVTQGMYLRFVRDLYAIEFSSEPAVLKLSEQAKKEAWIPFYNRNARLRQGGTGIARSVVSKIEAVALRVALILHVCETKGINPGPISFGAMYAGTVIAEWFRYEAARVYQAIGAEDSWLSRDQRLAQQLPEKFGWKDVKAIWGVKRRASFDIIARLIETGLAEKSDGLGVYTRCTLHSLHSLHLESEATV
jgi:uncharacterized protein DUF3987